jgi:hypothetical protein
MSTNQRAINEALFAEVQKRPQDRPTMNRVRATVRNKAPKALGEIVSELEGEGISRATTMNAAYDLIGLGRLLCEWDAPITDETVVSWWVHAAIEEAFARQARRRR